MNKESKMPQQEKSNRAEYHYQQIQELIDFENAHPQVIGEFGTGNTEINFTVGMHGNEVMPIRAVQQLAPILAEALFRRNGKCKFIACNVPAIKAQKRYIDRDLNDVFPGNAASQTKEEALAPEILELVKDAKHVVDLHTGEFSPPFGILPTLHYEKLELVEKSGLQRIVVFENPEVSTGPMVDFTRCGIGIEVGPHAAESSIKTAQAVILRYLHAFGFMDIPEELKHYPAQEYFQIVHRLPLAEGRAVAEQHTFKEFEPMPASLFSFQTPEQSLYPLLINPNRAYDDVYTYLAKKVSRLQLVEIVKK